MNDADEYLARIADSAEARVAIEGMEVEGDLRTPIVRELFKQMEVDAFDALRELVDCDPVDINKVRSLQQQVLRLRYFATTLLAKVQQGRAATAALQQVQPTID